MSLNYCLLTNKIYLTWILAALVKNWDNLALTDFTLSSIYPLHRKINCTVKVPGQRRLWFSLWEILSVYIWQETTSNDIKYNILVTGKVNLISKLKTILTITQFKFHENIYKFYCKTWKLFAWSDGSIESRKQHYHLSRKPRIDILQFYQYLFL